MPQAGLGALVKVALYSTLMSKISIDTSVDAIAMPSSDTRVSVETVF
jgi:hypothetical protein